MLRRPTKSAETTALQPVWPAVSAELQLQLIKVAADVMVVVSAQTSVAVAGMHLILFSDVIRVAGHPQVPINLHGHVRGSCLLRLPTLLVLVRQT